VIAAAAAAAEHRRHIHLLPLAYYSVSLLVRYLCQLLHAHASLVEELAPRRATHYDLALVLTERLLSSCLPGDIPGSGGGGLFSVGMLTRLIVGLLLREEEQALIKREASHLVQHPDERAILQAAYDDDKQEQQQYESPPPPPPTAAEDHVSSVSPDEWHRDERDTTTRRRGGQKHLAIRRWTSAGRVGQQWRRDPCAL